MSKRSRSMNRRSVKDYQSTKRSKSAKAKLAGQKKSLKAAKMAAVRQLANASTAGFLGIEKKFLDMARTDIAVGSVAALTGGEYDPTSTSGPAGGSGGCIGCLSCPAEGDSEQNRDGKKFVIDSLILKGHIDNPGTATTAWEPPTKVFVAVVLDTQTNGAQMSSEDCFKNLAADSGLNISCTKNLLSGNRFRILKSHVFDVTPYGVSAASTNYASNSVRREFDWYIPFKGGLPVRLKDGDANSGKNADVANVVDNSIHVIAFATRDGAYIGYNARIRFQG